MTVYEMEKHIEFLKKTLDATPFVTETDALIRQEIRERIAWYQRILARKAS